MIPRKHTYYFVLLLCFVLCHLTTYGQGTCSSSALAPVFSQTFGQSGSSSSKSSVPSGFITNYDFQSSGALNDGSYIVTPRVQNSGRNDWAQGTDHTGNSNGNMFLVNAGTGASIFFSQQVDNLCPGSTYNFSAWLANVNTTSHTLPICGSGYVYPNVTFNIKNTSGVILASYSTGNIPLTANRSVAPNWQQYGFSFSLPSGTTSLVLEMIDAYGGQPQCGNDLAIDDILFTACTPSATASFSTPSTICSGTNTSIQASIINNPFTNPAYQWQKSTDGGTNWSNIGTPGTSATTYTMNNVSSADQAMYRVLVGPDVASLSSSTCITASSGISLTVIPSPSTAVNTVSPICSGNAINLSSSTTGGVSPYGYSWSGPNSFTSTIANPIISNSTSANSGTYSLIVTGSNGCTATASTSVTVNTTPVVNAIDGPKGGCVGTNITLTNTTSGGVWSSSNTTVATINQSGVVSLLTSGTTTITYTVTANGCSASVTREITVASVVLGADLMECNNGVRSYSNLISNPYYVAYGNTNPDNTYLWTFTNTTTGLVETDIYKSGKSSGSDYPSVQLQNGNIYSVSIQYTTNDITCTATQTLYKSISLTGSIASAQDTSVCFNASNIPLRAQVSVVANSLNWYTLNGSGSFSSTNTLNTTTTYTPSAADRANGVVYIVFEASTSLNATGNCGSASVTDTMALHILPDNIGTSSVQTICSNSLFQHTPSSAVAGSTFIWTSSVISGAGSGNAASGNGAISNTLINNSNSVDYVVEYVITPQYNGCSSTPYTVRVNVKPEPELSVTNSTNNICTGTATNIVLNSTISGAQYTWTSSLLTGTATGNTNNITPSIGNTITDVLINNSNSTATILYNITGVTTDGCSSNITTEVIVYPTTSTANAGTDQNLCNATSTSLNAITPASGNGVWSFISGPSTPSFTNTSLATTTVSGLTVGTYTFRWTVSNGICASSQDDVTVTISALTVAGTLTPNLTVCAPLNSGTLTLSGYTGNIIHWEYSINGGSSWTTSNITSTTYTFNDLNTTTQYRATVQNGACTTEFSNMATVTVQQPPSTANAGPDQTINGISSAILSANNPTSGTGSWLQISGPSTANFTNVNQYNTNVSGLVVGTYTFRWTISNGICTSSSDEMILTVEPATVAGIISADATVCATGGNGATLVLSGYTGNILQWEFSTNNGSSWTLISNTTDQYTYSNLSTTTLYRALVQSGIGTPVYSSIATITVMQPVTTANAGTDQTLCNQNIASLMANNPASGNGIWSFVSGPSAVSFTNSNTYNSSVSGLSTGTYELKWTISNGVCPSSEDNVLITIVPPTVPGTLSADVVVCATSNSGTLTLSGYTGSIIQSEYSINNGNSWTTISGSAGSNTITYNNLSTTTLYRSQVKNHVCNSEYSNTVTITVLDAVTTANAGADQTVCSVSAVTLAGNQPTSGTGIWTQVSGPNTANFINASAYNTTVNGLIEGTYLFRWTISNGACSISFDDVTIHIDASTIAGNVLGSTTVCADNNSGTLLLTAHRGAIIEWASSTDNGNNWTIIANNTNSISYSNLSTTTAYRAQVKSGVCGAAYSTMATVQVDAITIPGTLSGAATVCNGNNSGVITLNGNNGTIVRWEYSEDGGSTWNNIANTSNSYSYTNLTQATIFRVLVKSGVCSNGYSNQVNISIDPVTIPGTTSGTATVCYGTNSGNISLTGNNGNVQYWEHSEDGGSSWIVINQQTSVLTYNNLTKTTTYRASVRSGVCSPAYSSAVVITVTPLSIGGTVSSNNTVCSGNNTGSLSLSGYTGSITGWQYSTDGGNTWNNIANTTASYTYANITVTTQYRAVVQNGVCSQVYSNPAIISVDEPTNPGVISGAITSCSGNNNGSIQLNGNNGIVIGWETSIDNGNTWINVSNNTNSYNYSNLITTTQFRALVQNGTCNTAYTNVVTIQIVPTIINTINTTNYVVCDGQSVAVNAPTPTGGTGTYTYQWQMSTDGINWTNIADAINSSYNFIPVHEQTLLRRIVTSVPCTSTSNTITVLKQAALGNNTINTNIEICTGTTAQIIGSDPTGGDSSYFYQWETSTDGGNTWNTVSGATQKDFTTPVLTANQLFRRIVTTQLCTGLQSNTSNTANIIVRPDAIAIVSVTNNTACTPFNVTAAIVQATHNATTNSTYEWLVNGVSIGTGINFPGYTLPLNQDQATIRLIANSLYNCKISTAEVIVNGSHPANPSFTISDTLGCGPMNVTINNTTSSIGNYTYSWYLDQTLISSAQQLGNLVLQRSISGLDTVYTLTLRASSPLCGTYSVSKAITVRAKPKVQFTATPVMGCSPVNITFQNQSIGNNTIYQYRFGDGKDTLLNTLSTITHTYTTDRLVTLSAVLLANNECGVDSMLIPITIRPDNIIPQLVLSDSSLCGPGNIRFSNQTTGALRFSWNFGDGTTLTTTDTSTISHQYQQPGTYTFSLIADNDCSIITINKIIRVHTVPIAAFSVNAPDFCVGDSIRINNQSSFSNIFRWSFSDGSASSFMNPVVVYKNAGVINATLIAGTIYTPDSIGCYDTITAPIQIVAMRKGSMEVTSLIGVCVPHLVNVKSLNIPAANVTWNWGDGKTGTGDTASYYYPINGNYTLTMQATSLGGCIFRDTANVVVKSPTGSLQIQNSNICLGQSATFNTQITDDQIDPRDSILWHTGDGAIIKSGLGSFSYQYTKAGIYHPKAFLVKGNGCMILLATNDSVKVDQVIAKFGLSAVFECGNTNFKFIDSSNAFFGVRSWKWMLDGRESSYEKIKVANFKQRGTHNAALEVESNTGCTANFTANFDVEVFQYPIANINAMAEACKTDLIQLKSNVSSQDSVVLRFWNLGNGVNARDSIVSATYTSEGKYNVKLIVATVNQCYDSVFKAVTVHPLPKITVDQNKIVCRGDSITIRANGASRFIWKDQNENILCNNCTEIKVKPSNSMGYQVIGYNEFGCSEIRSTNVRVINPLKMVASPGDTLCIGDSKTLFATGAASFSWLPANGLNATNSASVTVKPTETTNYKVVGKDAFNCFTDTATIKVVVGRPTPITLGRDTTITSGINYQLNVQSTNNDIVKWRWSGSTGISCITCPTPVVKLRDDACISCTVVNRFGCVSTDTVCIKTICPTTEVFVPNAFTPDGDGINDKLIVQGKGIRLIKSFRIFNRWGEVVFEKTNFNPGDPAYGWDGKIKGNNASPDVYVYVCEVICEKGLPSIFKGNTAILK
jgi:gliding motility-associated-like protein